MKWHRCMIAVLAIALASLSVAGVTAAPGDELFPNLQAQPASDVRLEATGDGRTLLRFSTLSQNLGTGPLELRAGEVAGDKQRVWQRVYLEGGGYNDYLAGEFSFHPDHDHFHFDDYALYTLQPENAPGTSQRTGSKVTFCVMDTTRIDTRLPGAPKKAVYSTCGNQVQGLSVGWGDKYGYRLAGQEIDITGLPDGTYVLGIEVDPQRKLKESTATDNASTLRIQLSGGTVTVLDGKKGRNQ